MLTEKQLISTGILDYYFARFKGRVATSEKRVTSWDITTNFNKLLLGKKQFGKDRSKLYLKKLQNDLHKLKKTRTHQNILGPMTKLVETKIMVCKQYIKLFRQPPRKDYGIDL